MSTIPIGIGNEEAQARFLNQNKDFLAEWQYLRKLIEQIFLNRAIDPPHSTEIERLSKLPETDPQVLAADEKYWTDLLVFNLGRIAVDDFSELVVLAGNGWGIGALKILRGMYERVVTAGYLGKNPHASRDFVGSIAIHKWKVWNRATKLLPEITGKIPQEKVDALEADARQAKARKEEFFCKRCGQPKTAEAWTQIDLDSMAKAVSSSLASLYLPCYLDPTSHMHATGFGVESRIEHASDSWTYRLNTDKEATLALNNGHHLLLLLAGQQIDYFNLGLVEELKPRLEAFVRVWSDGRTAPSPN